MTLVQILIAVRDLPPSSPRFGEAMEALRDAIRGLFVLGKPLSSHDGGAPEQDCREQTVADVWLEIYQQLKDGRFGVEEGDPDRPKRSYIARAARWVLLDCLGKITTHAELHEQTHGGGGEATDAMLDLEHARRLLEERVYPFARQARARQNDRQRLDRAWSQAEMLCIEGMSMDEVLRAHEGVTAESAEADRVKARNRVLTGQCRLRKALFGAVEALEAAAGRGEEGGGLSADEARLVRQLIDRLLYRRAVRKIPAGTSNRGDAR